MAKEKVNRHKRDEDREDRLERERRHRSRSRDRVHRDRRQRSRSISRDKRDADRVRPSRAFPPPTRQALPPPPNLPPPLHSIHRGTVHTVRPFGVFISIPGCRRHVLVHHSQISDDIRFAKDDEDEDKVKAMEFFLPKGQEVWVKLTEVTIDESKGDFKINGTLRTVNQETGEDLDPLNKKVAAGGSGPLSDEPPEEGTVHTAVVKRIEPYGVFVQLQGYRKFGLVHSSQVSNYISFSKEDSDESKKAELLGVVSVGESVHVKVLEVIPDDGTGRGPKMQCSIKLVDQSTGEDLDPTNIRYKSRGGEGGPGGPGGGGSAPIGAEAGAVKSGGKVDWGYLAGNDKLMAGDHTGKYKMLDGGDDEVTAVGTSGRGAQQQPLPPPPTMPAAPSGPLPPPPSKFGSIEEALAILEQAKALEKAKKKEKKHKDKGKKKKSKDKKEKKEKKSKKRRERSVSPSSSSDSD